MRKCLAAAVGFSLAALAISVAAEPGTSLPAQADRPIQKISPSSGDSIWKPSPEQESRIEEITLAYFSARDGSRHEDAYSRLSPKQKQYLPFSSYRAMLDDFNTTAGPVQQRQLRSITWYKDAPQAGPGLYAAVDYSSKFPNLALHCGYVVWHEQPDGQFLLVREETNVIDNATMAKLKPEELEKVRGEFRC
jgi:Protein of unknown function (DUF4019)